jgi:hypothetical protein
MREGRRWRRESWLGRIFGGVDDMGWGFLGGGKGRGDEGVDEEREWWWFDGIVVWGRKTLE